jgi:hypothetical protein
MLYQVMQSPKTRALDTFEIDVQHDLIFLDRASRISETCSVQW